MTNRKWVAAFAFCAAFAQIIELILALSPSGPTPAPGASADIIRKYHALHASGIVWLQVIDVLASIAITGFVVMLWRVLQAASEGTLHKWSRESLIALGSYLVVNVAADAVQLRVVLGGLDDAATRLLYGICLVLQEAALFPLGVLLIVLASDLRRTAIVPDWQGRWGILAGVFLLIGQLWIFVSDPFMVGMIQSFILAGSTGFVVWLVALGSAMLARREGPISK